jgi:hypothetical protein
MFRHGFELPEFAMFPLLDNPNAITVMRDFLRAQLDVAAGFGTSFLLTRLDYRASPDFGLTACSEWPLRGNCAAPPRGCHGLDLGVVANFAALARGCFVPQSRPRHGAQRMTGLDRDHPTRWKCPLSGRCAASRRDVGCNCEAGASRLARILLHLLGSGLSAERTMLPLTMQARTTAPYGKRGIVPIKTL